MPTTGAGGGGFGAGAGAVAGAVISTVVATIFQQKDAKKQIALQEALGRLSIEKQVELDKRLQDTQSELERQNILYKYLAVENNNKMLVGIKKEKYVGYALVGGGIILFSLVMLKAMKR